jgi:hypothetical protein
MNTSEEVVQWLIKFNEPLYIKLKQRGIQDNEYPFAKRIIVESVDIPKETN